MSIAERLRKVGEARGELRGRVITLLRQLQRRFGELPESTVRRVEAATLAELEIWTDRVLDRRTLRAVFAAPRAATRMKARSRAATGAGAERMSVAERLQQEARAQGRLEGRVNGLMLGRHDEASWIVHDFLNQRFGRRQPHWTMERVDEATLAELNLWTVRLFDRLSVAAVFAPTPLEMEPEGLGPLQQIRREVQARGLAKDLAKAWAKAFAKGWSEGCHKGWGEGRVLQTVETILLLLRKRFGAVPDGVVKRVEAADLGQLQWWRGRVLRGKTLDDVFEAKVDRWDWQPCEPGSTTAR